MRTDLFLFEKGYAKSRAQAQRLIESGSVLIDSKQVKKSSEIIDDNTAHTVVISQKEKYVSRGGLKLEAALDAFEIDVTGKIAIDIGASTGGFTDCLISRGASFCVAVDSGVGQLDPSLASNPKVKNVEKYNARELSRDIIESVDIAVMDVSFISQTLIHRGVGEVLSDTGYFISLIKPQFEAGRSAIGKGGIVKSEKYRFLSIIKVRDSAQIYGLYMADLIKSPITGGDGNIEYLALFTRDGKILGDSEIKSKMR